MRSELTDAHRTTYDAIFQHPVSRNLSWRDIREMLGAIAGMAVREEHNGSLKLTRDGRDMVLYRPSRKNLADVHQLMQLRRFLEQPPSAPEHAPAEVSRTGPREQVDADNADSQSTTGRSGKGGPSGFGRSRR
jgi:hypothetical protein